MGLMLFATPPTNAEHDGQLADADVAAFAAEDLDTSMPMRWAAGLLLEATGVGLSGAQWIPPERVAVMLADLRAADLDALARRWFAARSTVDALVSWFRICVQRGLGITAM